MLTVILLAILVFVIINNRNVRKYITALRTENKKDSVPFPVGAPSPQVFNKDEESKELHSLVFEYSDSETIIQFYAQVFGDEFVTDTKTLEISKEASGAV